VRILGWEEREGDEKALFLLGEGTAIKKGGKGGIYISFLLRA